jgi:hypothetical protein
MLPNFKRLVPTPVGMAILAPLEILKVLKVSCKDHLDKAKHEWDLKVLESVEIPACLQELCQLREKEVIERVESQRKDKFFNKYDIPRYIEHDKLHEYVSNDPAYKKILLNSVDICENKFYKLPLDVKVRLIREEAFVLALERQLIPHIRKTKYLVNWLCHKFQRVENSSDPAYRWLSRLSVPGHLKDHPIFLANWAKMCYTNINTGYNKWWKETFHRLPKEFWIEVLK